MCCVLLHVIRHMTNMLIYLCPTEVDSDQLEVKSLDIHLFYKIFKMLSQQSLSAQSQQKGRLDC